MTRLIKFEFTYTNSQGELQVCYFGVLMKLCMVIELAVKPNTLEYYRFMRSGFKVLKNRERPLRAVIIVTK